MNVGVEVYFYDKFRSDDRLMIKTPVFCCDSYKMLISHFNITGERRHV